MKIINMNNNNKHFFFLVTFYFLSVSLSMLYYNGRPVIAAASSPLYTNSRWIVDEDGNRVKLACVNWPSHLQTMVAEGLSKQPVDSISKMIISMGFNCVRFTWPLFLVSNDTLGSSSVTVRQSFESLGLYESIAGFQVNNPSLLDLPLLQAMQVVVSNMGENDVMVILDNHLSTPGWCCSNNDGNGFFGDKYFDPQLWLKGLIKMATLFNGFSNVVAMSLRNELRGPKQNVNDWYKYMQKGAEAVHAANPEVLVILSGLNFDKDFGFLNKKWVSLTFERKLVFELHWYAFTDGKAWETGNPNQVCGSVVSNLKRRGGFILEKGLAPLFLSEFGVDQRGTNVNDNRYLNCMMAVAAELDLDWALWTLAGSYYLRQGVMGMEECYGVLSWDWCKVRNSSFIDKISSIQSPFQGPGLSRRTYKIFFHPSTGLCVLRKSLFEPLELGSCSGSESWSYTPTKTIMLKGTYFCLQADGLGKPVKFGIVCTSPNSKWEMISDSKMHLSTKLEQDGTTVCLDIDSNNSLVTNPCKCLSRDHTCDPASQWFKFVDKARSPSSAVQLSLPTMQEDKLANEILRDQYEGKSIQ